MSRGGNRGGWSLTKLRSGQEDLSTAQAIGPSGSLSTAQATRPSGRLVTDQAGLEPERLVTDQAPVSGKLDDAAMTSRITPSGCSTIRPPGPRPTSATRTPSPSTSPTVTSRYSRRRRRGCGITRVSGDNAAAGQGAVFRESESSDWFGAATGVAAMKSIIAVRDFKPGKQGVDQAPRPSSRSSRLTRSEPRLLRSVPPRRLT